MLTASAAPRHFRSLLTTSARAFPLRSTHLAAPSARICPAFTLPRMASTSSVPSSMKAILIKDGKGPSENLYLSDHDVPQPGADEVLVKVKAFGLNRMDSMQRQGKYPLPPSAPKDIMGVEFSGLVATSNSSKFKEGEEVFGLVTGGAYAEYVKGPANMLLHKPKTLSHEQAAAIPEVWLTAFQALRVITNIQKGEDVLIHAGASGVGLAAIQLAKRFGARGIYVTAGSEEKIAACKKMGATEGFNYKAGSWAEGLEKATGGEGVDVVVDFIGAPYLEDNVKSLKKDGRLVFLAFMGGAIQQNFNLAQLLFKRLRLEGTTLRSRSLEYQSDLVQGFLETGMLEEIAREENDKDGPHPIIIHDVLPWDKIKEAHDMMEANKNTGKIVMVIP
ncbi:quinone oxidoreductase putative [Jaminaea rosea]|uniref:Quinone oxidoreductase putative n=1 Tax=Jaminaea rosea TaxID=1569628 RepID=A0A316UMB5_9BASI|nr:quinone oxidoreductase putative [Jaminaea rosea]PWN25521.1 quinone oxidoreductase putative [Jaminaea rosea]